MPLFLGEVSGVLNPPWRSGGIYPLHPLMGNVAAATGINTLMLMPFILSRPATPTGLGVRVSTGGAGSSVKIGLWAHDADAGRPTGIPLTSNNTGLATTTNNTTAILDVSGATLSPGTVYWVGAKYTGTLPTVVTVSNTSLHFLHMTGDAPASTIGSNITGISAPSTYADDIAADDLTAASFTNVLTTNSPVYFMRT